MTYPLISRPSVRFAAFVMVLSLTNLSANAQVKPFFVAGSGTAPDGVSISGADSPHNAEGFSIPVGPYTGDKGIFRSQDFDPETLSGKFKGEFVFEDLFGNELFCTYGDTDNGAASLGTYRAIDVGGGNVIVVFLAEFNPDASRSTGRFKKVTSGSLTMLAVTKPFKLDLDSEGFTPPFEYSWVGTGWIKFGRGRK